MTIMINRGQSGAVLSSNRIAYSSTLFVTSSDISREFGGRGDSPWSITK